MSWVKMDDQWPFHRKLRLVEPLDRLMWSMSIAYCSAQNTDGRLDGPMLEMVAFCAGVTKPYEAAERLVAAGLYDLDAGGWKVHDYLGFQPSSVQRQHISEQRSQAGKRGGQNSGKTRSTKGQTAQANPKQVASPSLPTFGTPSRPVPSSPVQSRPVQSKSSSGLNKSSVSQGSAEGDDDNDDTRINKALPLIADGLADLYDIAPKRRPGYKAAILRNPTDHQDALHVLANDHPTADPTHLAELYLATRRDAPDTPTTTTTTTRCTICQSTSHTADRCILREEP